MEKSSDTETSIQFWKMVEAKARLAINSIEYAKYTGNGAVALHAEGLADLQSYIVMSGHEMAARKITDAAKVNIHPGNSLSLG